MSIAILIQSQSATNGVDQTIVVPNYSRSKVEVFSRTSTGARGRSESWTPTSLASLPTSLVVNQPVAVRITESDAIALTQGKVTTLAVKLIKALSESDAIIDALPHADLVTEVEARLTSADSSLGEYLVDGRFKVTSVDIKPLSVQRLSTPSASPKISTVAGDSLSSVPDARWAREYIQRKCGGVSEFDIFDVAIRNGENVMLKGHAGSGKTMSAMAYASKRGLRYYNVSCSMGTDTKKMFGGFNPTDDGGFAWVDGAITELFRNGGVLVLDEVNMMMERMASELHSALDARREIQLTDKDGEVVKAHPDLLIVGAMNPNYRGTRELNQAFNDRFKHQLEYPYDASIERKLIRNSAVLEMAKKLRSAFEADEISTPISTRGLVDFMGAIQDFNLDYASYIYVNKFPAREQSAVKLVLQTMKANIERDLGITPATAPATESENI